MRLHPLHSRRASAFTLLELLVVLAIMAILVAAAALSLQGTNNSGKFNKAVGEISGIFDQARSYASAQNTYVWVALYQNTPANGGPLEVYAGAFASSDGTDPFAWTAATVTFPPGTFTVGSTTTTLTQITRVYHFKGLHLQTGTLPNAPTSPNFPATASSAPPAPIFQITAQSDSGPVTLSGASSVYWVIQFTPTGAARNQSNPVDSIWFGIQPSLTQTTFDTHNIASLRVNGLTGSTTVYRQ
jgi:prepilin-type N-terminal cleavage/methylation domain-containing protein